MDDSTTVGTSGMTGLFGAVGFVACGVTGTGADPEMGRLAEGSRGVGVFGGTKDLDG